MAAFCMSVSMPVAAKATLARKAAPARAVAPRNVRAAAGKDVESAVTDAKAACADGSSAECAAAWDVVEEISAAKSDAKAKAKATPADPLEAFCATAPDADECRVYED